MTENAITRPLQVCGENLQTTQHLIMSSGALASFPLESPQNDSIQDGIQDGSSPHAFTLSVNESKLYLFFLSD